MDWSSWEGKQDFQSFHTVEPGAENQPDETAWNSLSLRDKWQRVYPFRPLVVVIACRGNTTALFHDCSLL